MNLRRWTILVIIAYVLLAAGAVVTAYRFDQQQSDIKNVNKRLTNAAVAFCQAGIASDAQEKPIIDQLSKGNYHPDMIDPICKRIKLQIENGDDK